jgi:hypothetical protein
MHKGIQQAKARVNRCFGGLESVFSRREFSDHPIRRQPRLTANNEIYFYFSIQIALTPPRSSVLRVTPAGPGIGRVKKTGPRRSRPPVKYSPRLGDALNRFSKRTVFLRWGTASTAGGSHSGRHPRLAMPNRKNGPCLDTGLRGYKTDTLLIKERIQAAGWQPS